MFYLSLSQRSTVSRNNFLKTKILFLSLSYSNGCKFFPQLADHLCIKNYLCCIVNTLFWILPTPHTLLPVRFS